MLDIEDRIDSLNECENCRDVQIKKFSPLKDLINFDDYDGEYMMCQCGKRPLDIVMSHILKIMIETGIVGEKATLRRNSPVPLSDFYFSSLNPQFIQKNTLILLHPDFTPEVAAKLVDEVPEVKCVLKGSPQNVVGQLNRDSDIGHFEILEGDDTQINVMRTLLDDYLDNNGIKKGTAIDGMCGLGALGIYMLKYGFEKVIFNDINPEMIETLKNNLEINGIGDGFEIHNQAFEDLSVEHADLCVIDAFPGQDISDIQEKAEKIADNVVII